MGFAAWNPRLDFQGGADEDKWKKAEAIVAALGDRVTDLGGGSWRVMEIDAPTQEQAAQALAQQLKELDSDWRDVFAIATE